MVSCVNLWTFRCDCNYPKWLWWCNHWESDWRHRWIPRIGYFAGCCSSRARSVHDCWKRWTVRWAVQMIPTNSGKKWWRIIFVWSYEKRDFQFIIFVNQSSVVKSVKQLSTKIDAAKVLLFFLYDKIFDRCPIIFFHGLIIFHLFDL